MLLDDIAAHRRILQMQALQHLKAWSVTRRSFGLFCADERRSQVPTAGPERSGMPSTMPLVRGKKLICELVMHACGEQVSSSAFRH